MDARPFMIALALGLAAAADAAQPAPAPRGRDLGDAALVDQDGHTVRLREALRAPGTVVVDFISTRSREHAVMAASLARVQRLLAERMGKDVFFYSISTDGDRPEALKRYADAFGAGRGWRFLSGAERDVAALRARLAARTPRPAPASPLWVGNEAGDWTVKGAVDDARYLAILVDEWGVVARYAGTRETIVTPPLPAALTGRTIFVYKCAVCHADDGSGVGPSLVGVTTRRDRAWLLAWIRGPEQVLAKGDPTAAALVARYRGELMPNFALGADEATAVLDHLERMAELRRSVPAGL